MKFAVLALLLVCLFAVDMQRYTELMGKDACAVKVLNNIMPEATELAKTYEQTQNFQEKVEFLTLLSKVQKMMETCNQEAAPVIADPIEDLAICLLLISNCAKDDGIILLLLDQIIKDKGKDIPEDIIVAIFEAILANQAYHDCAMAEKKCEHLIPHA